MSAICEPLKVFLSTASPSNAARDTIRSALLSAFSSAVCARARRISRIRTSAASAVRLSAKVSVSCARRASACSSARSFFSASILGRIRLVVTVSRARATSFSACFRVAPSAARVALWSAWRRRICWSRSETSARRSNAIRTCSWRSNSTRTSPCRTRLPPATMRVTTRPLVFWPRRRGATLVAARTASTVPATRMLRTKGPRLYGGGSIRPPGLRRCPRPSARDGGDAGRGQGDSRERAKTADLGHGPRRGAGTTEY